MTTTKPELKSCPFCCGKIFLSKDDEPQFYFTCGTCLISFNIYAEGGREPSKDEAYRKMNSRPAATGEKTVINDTGLAEAVERCQGQLVLGSRDPLATCFVTQHDLETLINHAVKGEKS